MRARIVVAILLCLCGAARAQLQQAQVQGTVLIEETGKPLIGVTVVVSGPALLAEQTEFTDAAGRYLITQLPPGDGYTVRFYFGTTTIERPGIRLSQGQTLSVDAKIALERQVQRAYVIRERAPNVDVGSATLGAEINQEVLQNVPLRGRTFESILQLAPGTIDTARGRGSDIGVSIAGATGAENNFIIDGLNATDAAFGLISTQVHPYFIRELRVLTGGLQAEYGRTTGGVVSVLTKTGSNEFHGGGFLSYAPLQLATRPLSRLGEALATSSFQSQQIDVGVDLGGPIWKDRIWFYLGFATLHTNTATDRIVRRQSYDPARGAAAIDPDFACPAYLVDAALCSGPRLLAQRTTEVPERQQRVEEYRRLYNILGKLQFNLSPDHSLTLSYLGAPEEQSIVSSYIDDLMSRRSFVELQNHDLTARYLGKLFDRRLQVEVLYGLHVQGQYITPQVPDKPLIQYRASPTNPFSLADFEPVPECRREAVKTPDGKDLSFNPCPITAYNYQGAGFHFPRTLLMRHALQVSATAYLKLLGTHALKLGFDFEDNTGDRDRTYSGPDFDANNFYTGRRIYQTDAAGNTIRINRAVVRGTPEDEDGRLGVPCGIPGFFCFNVGYTSIENRNFALYLRDSWNVGFVPGLSLNLGLRWEAQEMYAQDKTRQAGFYENLAPRVGLVYDFTRKGRSRLYAHYGRYYQSIPLDVSERAFTGVTFLVGGDFAGDCTKRVLQPGGREVVVPEPGPGKPCTLTPGARSGLGQYLIVLDGTRGQYVDEVLGGLQYDVGLDTVLGVGYTYRGQGDVVEDLSADGSRTFVLGNPGAEADPTVASRLEEESRRAQEAAMQSPQDEALKTAAARATARLVAYKGTVLYPKPQRDYHALTLTANKRFSNRFSLLASYTFSRLYGNYPGTYLTFTGQLNPNTGAQFDSVENRINQSGPLSNDRIHNLKLSGYYVQPIGKSGSLTAGLTFTAFSGRPISVLGQNLRATLGTFILPSGAAGRTPTVTQFDLHLAYEHRIGTKARVDVFIDVINLLNQQAVTNVEETYTNSFVSPIPGGKVEDLRFLRATDGTALVPNSNFGQPTAYQVPLTLRSGARFQF